MPGLTLTLLPNLVVHSSEWKKAGLESMGSHSFVGCKYLKMVPDFRNIKEWGPARSPEIIKTAIKIRGQPGREGSY